ncbi:hypothetical protein OG369_31415 [Streptomyces sp. NBC_01221]|uniref:hypothetical protein n=1 Tax=unclassified Streptomyces TaxID=2593676 RepID=UPI002251E728|nr:MULTISPECIES: hypothetical protein [unclassified Streptomyces]WSP58790.1 hypothetical protein OG306_33740 [Streptomyces sp. NBC_01241]WSU20697.1 hypothetical protein OG508_06620 [Streptomyces sp. NBC_01108]MCX4790508.1 hypothetical protein [Streptomyces sp. NBC_01221]MCX4793765.1 hypothetical protein [Streptomyces sp. NBC_01242]WSJ35182.1 hypothetical protein OG772_03285 [Streptomyces sp. NBC_01321]
MDTEHPAWFPLSAQTSTAWTSKSARPANGKENLALLRPRHGFDLHAENTAKGGTAGHFDLAFATRSGASANIGKAEVEVSTEDGAGWHPATEFYPPVISDPKVSGTMFAGAGRSVYRTKMFGLGDRMLEEATPCPGRLFVFAVIEHGSRRIRIMGATAHP